MVSVELLNVLFVFINKLPEFMWRVHVMNYFPAIVN